MRRLVAYDGSAAARRALEHAALLHREGDQLDVLHVAAGPGASDGELDEAVLLLAARGIQAGSISAVGQPAHGICMTAERQGYDTIVIGRRNIRDAGLVLLGSVAARVVAGATCNVTVVA
jgi:nucleotide-binding universal stress UspA family protein